MVDDARSAGAAARPEFDELPHARATRQELLRMGEQVVVFDDRQEREVGRRAEVGGRGLALLHHGPVPGNVFVREMHDGHESVVPPLRHLVRAEPGVPRLSQHARQQEGELHRRSSRLLDCRIHGTTFGMGFRQLRID